MTAVARQDNNGAMMENVIIKGDLSKLTPQERSDYYLQVCRSMGLNPLTQPLQYITLNGKLTLYARKDCTDQLRMIHNVSVDDLTETEREGVFVVTAKVKNGSGRTDMATGAVNIIGLKGEALANALMKAETKAKRRATLSICGLGMLDELEVEDIPASAKRPNPHVTRPEDIVDDFEIDEQGNPHDNVPWGHPNIERLSNAKARPDATAANNEMLAFKTAKELRTWMVEQGNRVDSWPDDWSKMFRGRLAERLKELDAMANEPPPPPADWDGIKGGVTKS